MQIRLRAVAVLVSTVGLLGASLVMNPTTASATNPSCGSPNGEHPQNVDWFPTPTNVLGARGAIQVTTDGLACQGSGNPAQADYVAIQQGKQSGIAQVGFAHIWNSKLSVGQWCKFWAIDQGNSPDYYNCSVANNDERFFEVSEDATADVYNIYDCSSGTYSASSCTLLNHDQSVFSNGAAVFSEEVEYACVQQAMGFHTSSGSNVVSIGTPTYNLQEKTQRTSTSWGSHTLVLSGDGTCNGDYPVATDNLHYMNVWDSRNTS